MADRPWNERPALVPLTVDLVTGNGFAAWITCIQAYSQSFEFDLCLRRQFPTKENMDVYGFGRPGIDGQIDHVLFSMASSDGATMTNISSATTGGLQHLRSTGGRLEGEVSFRASRLPSPGITSFELSWPALGLERTVRRVDTSIIRDCSLHSLELWPEPSITATEA